MIGYINILNLEKEGIEMSICDTCLYYEYDEDYECYNCSMDLDEDEMYKFLTDTWKNCPYYRNNDEYEVVRHQM